MEMMKHTMVVKRCESVKLDCKLQHHTKAPVKTILKNWMHKSRKTWMEKHGKTRVALENIQSNTGNHWTQPFRNYRTHDQGLGDETQQEREESKGWCQVHASVVRTCENSGFWHVLKCFERLFLKSFKPTWTNYTHIPPFRRGLDYQVAHRHKGLCIAEELRYPALHAPKNPFFLFSLCRQWHKVTHSGNEDQFGTRPTNIYKSSWALGP